MKIKWCCLFGLLLLMAGCEKSYRGHGVFTHHQVLFFDFLWPRLIEVEMPVIDITKPTRKTYDLKGLPVSRKRASVYDIFIVIPSDRSEDPSRKDWGNCRFEVKKNGMTVQDASINFDAMQNNRGRTGGPHLNRLYIYPHVPGFSVARPEDHWEITFECSGFDSPEPVQAYVYIRSGGE